MGQEAARGFAHVPAPPERLADPISDRIAAFALKDARLLAECVDDADELVLENDRSRYALRARRFAQSDEVARVLRRIGPRRRIQPAHHLPVCDQSTEALSIGIARWPKPKSRGADIDLFEKR